MANPKIIVDATAADVRELLQSKLGAGEFSLLEVNDRPEDPFSPEPYGDLPTYQAVIEFTANAIAGGIIWDVLKKAARIVRDKYGSSVKTEGDEESGDETDGDD